MSETFAKRVTKAWRALTNRQVSAQKHSIGTRMYSGARRSRLTSEWNPPTSSADHELKNSLRSLRDRSRALVRDASYAKRARTVVVNNVIGTGIGMQAQVMTSRDTLNEAVNSDIEDAWEDWSEAANCHTGGRLSFPNLERALMGQVFEAGEVFVRKHYQKFGRSQVPYALELIESERLADEFQLPTPLTPGNYIRMGVEVDGFFRPVAYWIRTRHPLDPVPLGDSRLWIERVPAEEIIHLAVVDRWPQTRGEPWMHAGMRRLNDMDGYSEAEIIRARVQACTPGAIETTEDAESFGEVQAADGSVVMEIEPGIYKRLAPGEKLVAGAVTAPNPALDPFMRYMLREVAAATGVSYESISRDYSQSNYSSSRLALLDDRDLWKFYQRWFICEFRKTVHREWLQQAILAEAIPSISVMSYAIAPKKFEAVLFKPRGWSWIDPTSEVKAYEQAIKDGLTTVTDVIAQTAGGMDIEDILKVRQRELKMMKDRNLVFATSPEVFVPAETRGQIIIGPDGKVMPAAEVVQGTLLPNRFQPTLRSASFNSRGNF